MTIFSSLYFFIFYIVFFLNILIMFHLIFFVSPSRLGLITYSCLTIQITHGCSSDIIFISWPSGGSWNLPKHFLSLVMEWFESKLIYGTIHLKLYHHCLTLFIRSVRKQQRRGANFFEYLLILKPTTSTLKGIFFNGIVIYTAFFDGISV